MSCTLPLPASVLLISAKKVNEEVWNFHIKKRAQTSRQWSCVPSSRSRHGGFGQVGHARHTGFFLGLLTVCGGRPAPHRSLLWAQ